MYQQKHSFVHISIGRWIRQTEYTYKNILFCAWYSLNIWLSELRRQKFREYIRPNSPYPNFMEHFKGCPLGKTNVNYLCLQVHVLAGGSCPSCANRSRWKSKLYPTALGQLLHDWRMQVSIGIATAILQRGRQYTDFGRKLRGDCIYTKNGVFWDVMQCGSCRKRTFRRNLAPLSSGWQNRWTRNNVSCN
jgi:hypothetical protein